jgi:cAMP-dependent protein kinase regulator
LLLSRKQEAEAQRELVHKADILQNLKECNRDELVDQLGACTFKAGDYIMRHGDTDPNKLKFFLVRRGKVKVVTIEEFDGKQYENVTMIEEGDYFGELALMPNAPTQASVIAATDCRCSSINRETFERLMVTQSQQSQFKAHVILLLSRRANQSYGVG